MRDASWRTQFVAAVLVIQLSTTYSQNGNGRSAPMISSISSEPKQYYTAASTIRLNCSADGSPAPVYSWMLNNSLVGPINQTSGYRTIQAAYANATGDYQCLAANAWGTTMSNIIHLQMRFLNEFQDLPVTTMNPRPGMKVEIQCRGRPNAVPPPTYTWAVTRDMDTAPSVGLTMDNRRQIDPSTGSLHIAYVFLNDSDSINPLYACGAGIPGRTNYGSYVEFIPAGTTDTTQRLESAFSYPPTDTNSVLIVVEGQTVSLKCFFYGNPIPNIAWTGLQSNDSRVEITASGTEYQIANVSQDDDYRNNVAVTCVGSNSFRPEGYSHLFRLDVQVIPVFNDTNMGPVLTYGTIGLPATFYCTPAARPTATLTWYINGIQLTEPVPAKFSLSADRSSLTIVNVTAEDSMAVTCKAYNTYGATVQSAELRVVQLTLVTEVPSDTSAAEGESASFTCSGWADSLTTLSYLWLFNGSVINYTSNIYVTGGQTSTPSKLNIVRVNKDLAGFYTCRATNSYSYSDSPDVYLTVLPPIIPFDVATIWYVFLIIGLLILIFLLFLFLFCYCKDNEGDSYPVDEIEKKHGNDPVLELTRTGMQSYEAPRGSSNQVWTVGYGADAASRHSEDNFSAAGGGYRLGPDPMAMMPYAAQDALPPAYAVPNAGYIPDTTPSTLQRNGYPPVAPNRSRPQTPRSLNAMPFTELAVPVPSIPRTGTPGGQLAINPWAAPSPIDDPRNQPMNFSSFQPLMPPAAAADGFYQQDFGGQGRLQSPQAPANGMYARDDVFDPRIPSRNGPTPIRSPVGAHGYDPDDGGYGPGPAVGPYGGDLMGRFTPDPLYGSPAGGPMPGYRVNPYALEMAVDDRGRPPSESSV